jgi:hypothetical protein
MPYTILSYPQPSLTNLNHTTPFSIILRHIYKYMHCLQTDFRTFMLNKLTQYNTLFYAIYGIQFRHTM